MHPLKAVATFSERRPYHVLALIALVTVILGAGMASITMEAGMNAFLPEDDDAIEATMLLSEAFGGDTYEIALVTGDIVTYEVLHAIEALQETLRTDSLLSDYVLSSTSMLDLLVQSGAIEPGVSPQTVTLVQHALERDAASPEPRIVGMYISEGFDATRVMIQVVPDLGQEDMYTLVERLRACIGALAGEEETLKIGITGPYSQTIDNLAAMESENLFLFVAAGIFVLLVLFAIFRGISDMLFPFLTIGIALVWILGIIGYLSIPFTMMFVALAPLLLGIAVDYAIHIVFRYREERDEGKDVAEALGTCLMNTGTAVFLSAITTIFGFSSFFISDLPPIRNFGLLAVLGIFFSFVLVVTMLPALTVLRDRPGTKRQKMRTPSSMGRGLSRLLRGLVVAALHHRRAILCVTTVVTGASLAAAPFVDTALNWEDMMSKDLDSMQVSTQMDTFFASSLADVVYVLVEGDPLSPETITDVLDMEMAIRSLDATNDEGRPFISSPHAIVSYADLLVQANGSTPPASREVAVHLVQALSLDPATGALLARMLAIDPESGHYLTAGVISATVDITSEADMETIVTHIAQITENAPDCARFRPAGTPTIIASIMDGMMSTQIRTTLLSLVLCCLIVMLVSRSGIFGLLAILPVALTIAWEFLLLYLVGWSFDLFTVMISALIVGLGIDFAVHIIERFREEVADGTPTAAAIETVICKVGKALISATITTAGAFFIIGTSSMPILARFGQLTGVVLVFSFVAAVVVLPPVLAWNNERMNRNTRV
ncbi:MAG: MMPL family transporter [Candidatus Methanofastidiosa archaeon]|nr:MMPL family transporter [Candidatus Methanofastidiosa archaeon]